MRRSPTSARGHPLRNVLAARLGDESGMALVMALGIMLVLVITLTTVITFTAAGARDSQRTNAGQKAHSLAEAGVNNALGQLAAQYPSGNAQGNGGSPLAASQAYSEGTASWTSAFDSSARVWRVTATGTVPNPTGGNSIVRTATAKIAIKDGLPSGNFGIFSSDPAAPCTTIKGGTTVNVPVYVASCLIIAGSTGSAPAKIWEPSAPPTVTVSVGNSITSEGGATIGTSGTPVKSIASPSCVVARVPSVCGPGSSNFYATEYPTFAPIPLPPVKAQDAYDKGNWAGASCSGPGGNPFDADGIRNNSKGTYSIFALASFDCTVYKTANPTQVHGTLKWTKSTTSPDHKRLQVSGAVYLDGNLEVGVNEAARYTGTGTIYVNGTVTWRGVLCGPGSAFDVTTDSCSMQWNPDAGALMIVAANAAGRVISGTPALSPLNPNANGAQTAWTPTPSGQPGWSLVDEWPSVTTSDYVSSSTEGQQQDFAFPNDLLYDSKATYTVRIYARPGHRRGVDTQISINDSTFSDNDGTVPSGSCSSPCAVAWYARPVAITSQAQLNGFRLRLITKASSGTPTATEVHAVYLEQSVPTSTTALVNPAFVVEGGAAKLEAGTWTVGDFDSSGAGLLGGSVYVERGFAKIEGNGSLKAFAPLPDGVPSQYGLADSATDFG